MFDVIHGVRSSIVLSPRANSIINCRTFSCCVQHEDTIWAATWQNQQNECAPSEDSDQSEHPPSPIRVFAVRMKKAWVLSYPLSAQRRLWSDWADVQADLTQLRLWSDWADDLSLRWAHSHFIGFVMRRLMWASPCEHVLIIHRFSHT